MKGEVIFNAVLHQHWKQPPRRHLHDLFHYLWWSVCAIQVFSNYCIAFGNRDIPSQMKRFPYNHETFYRFFVGTACSAKFMTSSLIMMLYLQSSLNYFWEFLAVFSSSVFYIFYTSKIPILLRNIYLRIFGIIIP